MMVSVSRRETLSRNLSRFTLVLCENMEQKPKIVDYTLVDEDSTWMIKL